MAQLLIPNSILRSLGGGGNVTVTAALDKDTVELFMTRGTQVVDRISGGVVLTVPMAASTPGTTAVVLHNLEDNPESPYSIAFQDVGASNWHTEAIAWTSAENIASGYGNGLFGPNDNITCEQLAVMLWRYAGRPAAN